MSSIREAESQSKSRRRFERKCSKILTQLIAIVAGVNLEKLTMANRNDPAGTGAGGTISETLPYGYH